MLVRKKIDTSVCGLYPVIRDDLSRRKKKNHRPNRPSEKQKRGYHKMAGNSELWVQCFTCCLTPQARRSGRRNNSRPHQRLRIDRSMIGLPTNFRHTAHISSGDIDMSISQLADLQAQMQRKSGFDSDFGAKV
ncbi:CDC42 small effector protein homolog isoform X2 [Pseudomyrmex gracilis]|uniref:CDC42 small effector protein homolog isoform X2 n=1 Tax=Pseudomyrmex gracilis TaxID=219809 RepID=UPI00099560C1|nr:CDC42 small effector protein homolog isoform X2 [Pseudomyrmex gracilis]